MRVRGSATGHDLPAGSQVAGSGWSGLAGGEVVEENDHADPELLGGQGVGLYAAAQLLAGEEREYGGKPK
jgi:hypothetical protein